MTFVCWPCFFLTNRRATVQLHNVCDSNRHFNQGLSYGSVLASLLFLFYINNLADNLSNDAVIALFADDISILKTAYKKEDSVAAAQSEVNEWSQTCKLNLNEGKCECCPFSTCYNDTKRQLSLTIGGQKIRVNNTLRLLGVSRNQSLSFNAHVKHIKQSLSSRLRAITVTAHTSWG